MKLTEAQKRAYSKLLESKWQNAYELGEHLGTLRALVDRKLAESKAEIGHMAFPRNSIMFRRKEPICSKS